MNIFKSNFFKKKRRKNLFIVYIFRLYIFKSVYVYLLFIKPFVNCAQAEDRSIEGHDGGPRSTMDRTWAYKVTR